MTHKDQPYPQGNWAACKFFYQRPAAVINTFGELQSQAEQHLTFLCLLPEKEKKITVVTRFTVLTKSRQVVQYLLASYFHNLSNARKKGKLKRSGQKKSYSVRNFNLCTQTPTAINVKQRRSSQNDASTRLVTFSTKTRTLGFYLTKYM